MATIPFKDYSLEIKPILSAFDVSIELQNIQSSIEMAANELKNTLGKAVYQIMIDHYNSEDFGLEGFEALTTLVAYYQKPLATLGFFNHQPYLAVRVSNDSISRTETNTQKSAYKYQLDALNDRLIQETWIHINNLIEYMDSISTDEVFPEWKASDEYKQVKNLLFANYNEFDRYFSIDKSAYFFYKCRYIIEEITVDEISPRIQSLSTIQTELQEGTLSDANKALLMKINRYLAYATISCAMLRFDYFDLPRSIRAAIDSEMRRNNKTAEMKSVKENIKWSIDQKANDYLRALEVYIDTQTEKQSSLHTVDYTVEPTDNTTDKYFAIL